MNRLGKYLSRKAVYRLFISEAVVEEASRGDAEAARRRLEAISELEELSIDEPVLSLTREIFGTGLISGKASADALHIAVAARYGVDDLVTWNCKPIANAEKKKEVRKRGKLEADGSGSLETEASVR